MEPRKTDDQARREQSEQCDSIPPPMWGGIDRPRTIQEDVDHRFTYHPPMPFQTEKYIQIRNLAKSLAYLVANLAPESREQSLAITHIEEAVFWANAAIARH